jgi:hypothetical protein
MAAVVAATPSAKVLLNFINFPVRMVDIDRPQIGSGRVIQEDGEQLNKRIGAAPHKDEMT